MWVGIDANCVVAPFDEFIESEVPVLVASPWPATLEP
jgi:hypothetical protein